MRSPTLPGAALALCLACAPTRPPVDDGCLEGRFPASVAEVEWCAWPEGVPLPSPEPPPPAVAARERTPAPGTLVMPPHPEVIAHGPRDAMRIALTFDACTSSNRERYDGRIIRTLVEQQVPATIFAGGRWARREAENLKALARNALFEVGNHSYMHPHLPRASEDRIRRELSRAQEEIAALTGVRPVLFRAPFGEYDDRVVRIALELGLRTVQYDLPAGDSGATREALVEWVVEEARPGSIVVMHLNHPEFATADALPEIIARLRERGFSFAKVSDLVGPERVAVAPASPAPGLPEEQLGDVRDDEGVQAAHRPVSVPGVEALSAGIEVGDE